MSLLQLSDPLVGGSLSAHLHDLNVQKLYLNGREVTLLSDTASLQATIQQIQQKIAELDAFCRALSEALVIGPGVGESQPATYPPGRN
jgi:hypothetical protein